MSQRELNYKEDVMVVKEHLDEQWIEYPTLIYLYSKRQSELQKEYNDKKEEYETQKAAINLGMRTNPDDYKELEGVTKFTEAIYESATQIHPVLRKKRDQLAEIKHNLDLVNAVCNALREKKYSLQNVLEMVKLELIELKISSSNDDVKKMKRKEADEKSKNRRRV